MPAASAKAEIKASHEVFDPIKQALILVDRKVRNLEKRKSKLDAYKQKADEGSILEREQEDAVSKYGEVVQNLEFARELQKQFLQISLEGEKHLKKQVKREKMERQVIEVRRIQELLQLQNVLDSLGSESTREDFRSGKHGAVVLTEENLTQLDELYKLICPTRDGENEYKDELSSASEHVHNLLEARDKEVVGTTYKELNELIDLINGCGYFENAPLNNDEEPVPEVEAGEVQEDAILDEYGAPSSGDLEAASQERVESLPRDDQIAYTSEDGPTLDAGDERPTNDRLTEPAIDDPSVAAAAAADSFFSTAPAPYIKQRPFQEIVMSVQGNYNFLQESTIDMESPHMDPAVVAAHPMAPTLVHGAKPTVPEATSLAAYPSQAYHHVHQHHTQPSPPSSSQQPSSGSDHHVLSHATQASPINLDYSGATYGHLSQSLQQQASYHSVDNDPSSGGTSQLPPSVINSDMPPAIPLPSDSQESQSQTEKKFTMNVSAPVFQSMYTPPNMPGDGSPPGDGDFGGNFTSGSFSRGGTSSGRGSTQSSGGFRGNNGRGGRNSSNGFQRGGQTGRASYSNAGNRGAFSNGDVANGGSSGYQGYQQRSEYRSDGFQSYNNNTFSSNNGSSFQKSRPGMNRGNMAGGMRGGASRGGVPRGNTRGGRGTTSSSSFARTGIVQQQQ